MFKAVLVYNLHMASFFFFFFLRNSLNSKRIISLLLVNQLILSGMLQLGVIALFCLKMILAFLLVGHLHKSEIILFLLIIFFFSSFYWTKKVLLSSSVRKSFLWVEFARKKNNFVNSLNNHRKSWKNTMWRHHELLLLMEVNLFLLPFLLCTHDSSLYLIQLHFAFAWKCPIVSHSRSLTVLQVSIPLFPSIQILKNAGTNSSRSHKVHIGFSLAHSGQSRAVSHCSSFCLNGRLEQTFVPARRACGDVETSQWILMLKRIKLQKHSLCEPYA